ncbi:MAG TPA: hypothetical protein VMI31_03830, partial [Fimbriimonadaceae bacterium]|nr:hypothetical protein [Fimbriimonadaceae bacterium]
MALRHPSEILQRYDTWALSGIDEHQDWDSPKADALAKTHIALYEAAAFVIVRQPIVYFTPVEPEFDQESPKARRTQRVRGEAGVGEIPEGAPAPCHLRQP